MRGFLTSTLCLLALSVAAPVAQAAEPIVQTSEIIAEQQVIKAGIEARTGRYEDMPGVKRRAILADQTKLFGLLEGKTSTAELSPEQKTQVFNTMQAITAAINNKDDERIVCERQKTTGSHRVTRVCRSVAQIREEREIARRNMQVNQGLCNSGACAPSLSN